MSQSTEIKCFGNVATDATTVKFAGTRSIVFDGTDDYLDVGDIRYGSGDFTVEGWFNFQVTNVTQELIGRYNTSNSQGWELIYASPSIYFQTNAGSNNTGFVNWAPTIGQWYHIAAVRSGTNKYLFIDGTLQSGFPINIGTGELTGESTGTVKIGTRLDLSTDFNGYMQDVRITKGLARYTSNFTPPTTELEG